MDDLISAEDIPALQPAADPSVRTDYYNALYVNRGKMIHSHGLPKRCSGNEKMGRGLKSGIERKVIANRKRIWYTVI